ncbi:hypothetical protein SKAU_G00290900 [Synaphobranchus kaupii]|uniref:Uncharacterized protein n=1 Tax=Synaphobranchus kaupii TaxID=118154 RepID=A0A9Q1ETR6_SYNKA|nr:hypothetical protein SKAU_G00290900 [Synaphobranchus kaupii]
MENSDCSDVEKTQFEAHGRPGAGLDSSGWIDFLKINVQDPHMERSPEARDRLSCAFCWMWESASKPAPDWEREAGRQGAIRMKDSRKRRLYRAAPIHSLRAARTRGNAACPRAVALRRTAPGRT